jgi:phosphopentomutase
MVAFSSLQSRLRSRAFNIVNLVDFDMLWGHRNDPIGYAEGLVLFDHWLTGFMEKMSDGDLLFITADHGNDPTTPGTDHTREYVPILGWGPGMKHSVDLGTRSSFADFAETVLDIFKLRRMGSGISFWPELKGAWNG